jgi:hypothetical protein
MCTSKRDKVILRELASQVAEIAALPVQQEKIALWKGLNDLKPARPMVMIGNVPWHEMDVDGELALQTEDDFCRDLETELRRTLYSWNHMPVDMVVEPVVDIPKITRGVDFTTKSSVDSVFGIATVEHTAAIDPHNEVVAHQYFDQLKTEEDVQKIVNPTISLDEEATAQVEAEAHDIFDGIIAVETQGYMPTFAPWDRIVNWRGAQNALLDLADRPDLTHQIMNRLTEAFLCLLDQLEEQGILGTWRRSTDGARRLVQCSGAYTNELPAAGYDPARPRARDVWTYGMAQIFSEVSPEMHQEFELDYAIKWYSRFGLVYYGCCDPLDRKIDLLRQIPNLRKISMSPWVDEERGAERIGGDFVFSRKPSPAIFVTDPWEPDAVERDLRQTVEHCNRYGVPLEIIMKDLSTVRYRPERLWEWADVAMKVVTDNR